MKAHLPNRKLTAAQKKALIPEIEKEILYYQDKFYVENTAAILWTLHITFGFGKKRLKEFWDAYFQIHDEIVENYQLDDLGEGMVYKDKLKRIGVDIEEWCEEKR